MTDIFNIAASGVRAYRAAMATVADNVANADDPAYIRRRLALQEVSPGTGLASPLYARNTAGHGAAIFGTVRQSDALANHAVRDARAASAAATARRDTLERIEGALGGGLDSPASLPSRVGALFAAGDRLAASPSDPALQLTFQAAIDDAARSFRLAADQLTALAGATATQVQDAGASAQGLMDRLAGLNRSLLAAQPGTAATAQLLDQRDTMLEALSDFLPIETTPGPGESVTVTLNGTPLVAGTDAATLLLATDAAGAVTLSVDGVAVPLPDEGRLAGLAAGSAAVAQHRSQLDTLAQGLVTALNGWHAAGMTPGGVPGAPLLTATCASDMIATGAALALGTAGSANGNLLALGAVRSDSGAENGLTALIAGVGLHVVAARADAVSADGRADAARDRRDAVSGVDLDMEAAELVRLQQAYDAAARVLQVARETVQSILAIF